MEGSWRDTDSIRVVRLVSETLAAMLTIQTLHAPHIASRRRWGDERDRADHPGEGGASSGAVSISLCRPSSPQSNRAHLIHAAEAFSEYADLTRTVIELSRQNTNVTSFEISLSRKLKMTAQCELILGKLQEAIKAREYKATR